MTLQATKPKVEQRERTGTHYEVIGWSVSAPAGISRGIARIEYRALDAAGDTIKTWTGDEVDLAAVKAVHQTLFAAYEKAHNALVYAIGKDAGDLPAGRVT